MRKKWKLKLEKKSIKQQSTRNKRRIHHLIHFLKVFISNEGGVRMPVLTYLEAINSAMKEEMARDEKVFVLGEDVGKHGGVFKATAGLYEQFGEKRVIDTPLAVS